MRSFSLGRRLARGGNVLLLVALSAVPLIGVVALAVDFGQTSSVKSKLDLAADSAALLATTAASNAWKAGDQNAIPEAIAAAKARFVSQAGFQPSASVTAVNVVLTQVGGLFTATVNYIATAQTTFARVLGITTLPIGGQSSSSLSLNPYVDIQILMDVSSSMTLAATPAGMASMVTMVAGFPSNQVIGDSSKGCTLACHWSTTDDYYLRATQQGIPLRITVLRTAVGGLITTLAGLDSNNRFRLGLYSFNTQLNTVYPLSSDVAGAMASIAGIAPDIICATCLEPETFFSKAMASLKTQALPPPAQANLTPQRFLFIVTDGVYDQTINGNRQLGPVNPSGSTDCSQLKALGVNILVLYTPYMAPVPANAFYVSNILPFAPQIVPNLQACASSPSYFFVANDATAINTQLQSMLQLVVQASSHLTN
jgi:Flp pilus assembly protein TadG